MKIMKKQSIYALMSAIALAGAVGLSACSSSKDDVGEVSPGSQIQNFLELIKYHNDSLFFSMSLFYQLHDVFKQYRTIYSWAEADINRTCNLVCGYSRNDAEVRYQMPYALHGMYF